MIKTLQKHLLINAVFRLTRIESLVSETVIHHYPDANDLNNAFQQEFQSAWTELEQNKQPLLAMYSSQALESTQCQQVWDHIKVLQDTVDKLSRQAQMLLPVMPEPECSLFLNNTLPLASIASPIQSRLVRFVDSIEAQQVQPSELSQGVLKSILVEQLPLWGKQAPDSWMALGDSWANQWAQHNLDADVLTRLNKLLGSAATAQACIASATLLRVLGPAYYWHLVLEGTASKNQLALSVIEPVLFYGLNHWGFTHKNLVMFHEGAEKVREWAKYSDDAKNENTFSLPVNDNLGELFRAIDNALPEKLCFGEKNLARSEELMGRLEQQTLASSLPTYMPSGLSKDKSANAQPDIYSDLQHLTEMPVSPVETINAAWMLRVEHSHMWLFDWLMVSPESMCSSSNPFAKRVLGTDALICKSIETAQVHQMLLEASGSKPLSSAKAPQMAAV